MHSWDAQLGCRPVAFRSELIAAASRSSQPRSLCHPIPPPSAFLSPAHLPRHSSKRGYHSPGRPPGRLTGTVGWLQEQTTRTSLVSCSRPTDGADADSALPAELCIWSAYMVCICGLHMWSAHVVCKYGLHVWPTRRTCRQLERRHTITRVRGTMEGGMEVRNITPAALAIAMHAAPDGVPCPCAPTLECQQTRQGGRTWT